MAQYPPKTVDLSHTVSRNLAFLRGFCVNETPAYCGGIRAIWNDLFRCGWVDFHSESTYLLSSPRTNIPYKTKRPLLGAFPCGVSHLLRNSDTSRGTQKALPLFVVPDTPSVLLIQASKPGLSTGYQGEVPTEAVYLLRCTFLPEQSGTVR